MNGRRRPVRCGDDDSGRFIALGAVQLRPGHCAGGPGRRVVGYRSCDDLLDDYRSKLLRAVTAYGFTGPGGLAAMGGVARDSASTAAGAPSATSASAGTDEAVGSGPTGTNLQEQGVDEPDIAKLSDGRLVVLTGNRLQVVTAAERPEVLGSLRVGDPASWGGELLLAGDRALVVVPRLAAGPADRSGRRRRQHDPALPAGDADDDRRHCSTCRRTSPGCSRPWSSTVATSAPGSSAAPCGS